MFLERFVRNCPFILDVNPKAVSLTFDERLDVLAVTGRYRIVAPALPMAGRIEELAEKILAYAAEMNEPLTESEARARYARGTDLDLGEGHLI